MILKSLLALPAVLAFPLVGLAAQSEGTAFEAASASSSEALSSGDLMAVYVYTGLAILGAVVFLLASAAASSRGHKTLDEIEAELGKGGVK